MYLITVRIKVLRIISYRALYTLANTVPLKVFRSEFISSMEFCLEATINELTN